eukprot:CAMPEP_0202461468 /NCGR_PEP_ID=MMETSP1360-20130828/49546_1 /ASSEMBLY_ACC=CAM_ASM_000848 /TAXON_ID=515479 /ORGANISM="Licmophora paradoxa, Strain CCMP2313" /LENGTH=390 /DNA_ID=CAMNT_0049083529 /DNA_START=42 /DNA_END=1214 /DNA_ORIENTATION=+
MAEDKTAEFLALAKSLPAVGSSSQATQPGSVRPMNGINNTSSSDGNFTGRYGKTPLHPAYDELRNFHQTASGISKDIAATSHMLQQLALIVKSNSLFHDDSSQVNQLVTHIKKNIESLNGRLDEANATIQYQKRRLGRNSQAGQEASNLVGQLKEEFVNATAGFKKVLKQRTDTLKAADDQKREVYGGDVDFVSLDNKPPVYGDSNVKMGNTFPTLDLTSAMAAGEPTGSLPRPHGTLAEGSGALFSSTDLRMRRASSSDANNNLYGAYGGTSAPLTPLDMQRMEAEGGLQMQLIPDQNYLRERADAMSTVETNIVELGTIFNKLAVMVSEHGEMVQRVEDNVDEANSNINLSMNVLTDTLTSLRTNKALATKVFGILVAFVMIFIIFFA